MYELDKCAFGAFVAAERKAKGYTQKDLAEKLFVSDKAISKWERGLSVPDVSLLVPLAGLLGVTVTELLEGRRLDTAAPMPPEEVETVVQKALTLAEAQQPAAEPPAVQRRKFVRYFAVSAAALAMGFWVNSACGLDAAAASGLWFTVAMAVFLGWCVRFGLPQHLPPYYDEYRINSFSDGVFRMNLAGAVNFNNHNWPHILRAMRVWSAAAPLLVPPVCALCAYLGGITGYDFSHWIFLPYLAGLVVPVVYVGRKYEYGAPQK